MKTIYKSYCPEVITYNGRDYSLNTEASRLFEQGLELPEGRHIIVKVLARQLKYMFDLHGKPYRPHTFIYTTPLQYKVRRIFKVSGRRLVLRRGLTRDEAKALVNSFPDCSKSMVVFSSY